MGFVDRFKTGLNIGIKGFSLLWDNKKLLIYLGTPMLIGITIELITYLLSHLAPTESNIVMRGIMVQLFESFGWSKNIGLFFTQIIKLSVTVCAASALIYHVNKITKQQPTNIKESIWSVWPKIKIISLWSALSTAAFLFINYFDDITLASQGTPCLINAIIFSIVIRIIWSLVTLFVVQTIVFEQHSLVNIIKQSWEITKKMFPEYLGAIFWLGLISILAFLPFGIIKIKSQFVIVISYIAITLLLIAIASVHTMIKTLLYQRYAIEK